MAYRSDSDDDAVRSLVQHEAVHWLLASKRHRLPAWLDEGLAEMYSTFSIRGNTCRLFEADIHNVVWLRSHGIASLDAVLAFEHGGLDFEDREKVRHLYAQAWAMTHYVLCGDQIRDGGERIIRYLEALQAGKPGPVAFEEGLGMSVDEMRRRLTRYVERGRYTILTVTFPRDELRTRFQAEPAEPVEVECALALALVAGRRNLDAAELRLRQARDRWPDSPLPYQGLAAAALARGDRRKAAGLYRAAAERGSQHAYAHFFPAADELADRMTVRPRPRDLRPEDARRLSDALIRALELDRNLARAADHLGLALLFTEPLRKSDVQFLARVEAAAEDPLAVRYRLAGLLHRLGDARARSILETLAGIADHEPVREAAAADLAAIEAGADTCVVGARHVVKPRPERASFRLPIERPGR